MRFWHGLNQIAACSGAKIASTGNSQHAESVIRLDNVEAQDIRIRGPPLREVVHEPAIGTDYPDTHDVTQGAAHGQKGAGRHADWSTSRSR